MTHTETMQEAADVLRKYGYGHLADAVQEHADPEVQAYTDFGAFASGVIEGHLTSETPNPQNVVDALKVGAEMTGLKMRGM